MAYFPLVVAIVFVFLFHGFYIDDTYITLKYVNNLIQNFEWGMYPGIPANSATSPFNVILLSLFTVFTQDPELSVLVSNYFWIFVIYLYLEKIRIYCGLRNFFTPVMTAILIINPFLFSSLGLESLGIIGLFILFLNYILKKNFFQVGLLTGLLYLSRPDSILLCFFFLFLDKVKFRNLAIAILTSFLVVLPWITFSYFYFGSILPDTLLIKTKQSSWGSFNFSNGLLLYFEKYTLEFAILLFIIISLFIFIIYHKTQKRKLFSLFAVKLFFTSLLHFIAYSFLSVPPYHWYYVPSMTAFLLGLGVLGFQLPIPKKLFYTFILGISIITSLIFYPSLQIREMPIHTNWTSRDNYKTLAIQLDLENVKGKYYFIQGEIGTLAYFSKEIIYIDSFSSRLEMENFCKTNPKIKKLIPILLCLNLTKIEENNLFIKGVRPRNIFFNKNQSEASYALPIHSKWIQEPFYIQIAD